MLILIAFAFVAGIVTLLSPCILPVLPILLSGSLTGGKRRPLGIIVGFILSFTFFTIFSFAIVKALGISPDALRNVAFIVLFLFGLSLLIPQLQNGVKKLFEKLSSMRSAQAPTTPQSGFGGGVLVGLSLGLIWTPCVGPILASVITLAATSSVSIELVLITFSYALGTALPMLAIAYGGRGLLQRVPWVLENTVKIQRGFGVVMILIALMIALNLDRKFQTFILEKFPQYGAGLTQFEENQSVKDELDRLQNRESTLNTSSMPKAPNPNFDGATKWLNSEPLTLEQLKGKVVLVDFWTYTCINCIRTLPHVTSWYEKYKDQGLVVIGVHTPEFEFEKKEENVLKAMKDFGINYPVVQDNDYGIWKSYENRYWPAEYFIDKNGWIRRTHFGEGEYEESERFIQELLAETGATVSGGVVNVPDVGPTYAQSPETYLGYWRLSNIMQKAERVEDVFATYVMPVDVRENFAAFGGEWNIGEQRAMAKQGAALAFHFFAKEVYLVMRPSLEGVEAKARVMVDGQLVTASNRGDDVDENGIVTVSEDRLYRLVKLAEPERHTVTLEFLDNNTEVYAFTFG